MSGGLDTGFDESTEVIRYCGVVMIGSSVDIKRAMEALVEAARYVGVSFRDLKESLISLVEIFDTPKRTLPDLTLMLRRMGMDDIRETWPKWEEPLDRIRLSRIRPRVRLLPSPPRARILRRPGCHILRTDKHYKSLPQG